MLDWPEITMLSDIVSIYIYEMNNKKYIFLGDAHFNRSTGGCEEKYPIRCDDFNINTMTPEYYGTKCTSIGVLLHHWFIYNNDHNITTDFYLEVDFTEAQSRIDVNKLKTLQYDSNPYHDKSWMQLLSYVMEPCFIREKINCPYYPNVRAHYADMRFIDFGFVGLVIDPFLFSPKKILIDDINELIVILYILIYDYKNFIDAIIQPDAFDEFIHQYTTRFSKLSRPLSLSYLQQIKNMEYISVIRNGVRMHRTAAELLRLHNQSPDIAKLIKLYVYDLAKKYSDDIKADFKMDIPIFNSSTNSRQLVELFRGYEEKLISLSTLSMDAYLLSRMFLQDSQEIITFAGHFHIKHYVYFFEHYLQQQSVIKEDRRFGNKCINNIDLPKYLNANLYRQYVANKN